MLVLIMIGCDCTLLSHGSQRHSFFFIDDAELRFQKMRLGLTVKRRPRSLVIIVDDWGLEVVGERRDEIGLNVVVRKTAAFILLRTVEKFVLGVIDLAL